MNTSNGSPVAPRLAIDEPDSLFDEAQNSPEDAKQPRPLRKSSDQKSRLIIVAALAVVGVLASGFYLRFVAPYESTDDAFIEGRITAIAPQVPGRVARLLVQDNQEVKRGEVLVEIDPSDYQARLTQCQANLAGANSRLEQANAQLLVDQARAEQEQANVRAAEAEASRAQTELKRYQSVESRAVSRIQVDAAETVARSASAQADVARSRARAAEAQLKLSQASILAAKAEIQQGEAAVRQAELNVSYTKVIAPDDGHVSRRSVEVGAYIQPGQAIMAIVPRQVWVVANFKETQLTKMHAGQPAEIKVDAYPGQKFQGHVESIQRGAGAKFSLFPPENATGNYVKVVQRVPVKIIFDAAPDDQLVLGSGMSVEPTVKVN